jgi:hypothetical protein
MNALTQKSAAPSASNARGNETTLARRPSKDVDDDATAIPGSSKRQSVTQLTSNPSKRPNLRPKKSDTPSNSPREMDAQQQLPDGQVEEQPWLPIANEEPNFDLHVKLLDPSQDL